MADARKCDRCGNYYSGVDKSYQAELIIIETIDGCKRFVTISPEDIDLCPKCRESLYYWWKFVRSVDDFLHIHDKKQEEINNG